MNLLKMLKQAWALPQDPSPERAKHAESVEASATQLGIAAKMIRENARAMEALRRRRDGRD